MNKKTYIIAAVIVAISLTTMVVFSFIFPKQNPDTLVEDGQKKFNSISSEIANGQSSSVNYLDLEPPTFRTNPSQVQDDIYHYQIDVLNDGRTVLKIPERILPNEPFNSAINNPLFDRNGRGELENDYQLFLIKDRTAQLVAKNAIIFSEFEYKDKIFWFFILKDGDNKEFFLSETDFKNIKKLSVDNDLQNFSEIKEFSNNPGQFYIFYTEPSEGGPITKRESFNLTNNIENQAWELKIELKINY